MKPLKVSELNSYIKRVFSSDMILSNIQIEGEISNFKRHISGHLYFSLKDDKSLIKCVMFKGDSFNGALNLSEGQKVIAKGYVSIYERNGDYQLYVKEIEEAGIGNLYAAFEKLKNKLEKEGLFEEKYKKPLPFLPKNIGVVTSPSGAAVHDIINIVSRRFNSAKLTIYPSLVQGSNAPKEIINGLKLLDENKDVEVIIVGRGGGSLEDLFCFNDEDLARCIFNLKTPVISAVGHETDFTIIDFVSDLRAPTPSAAAELVVPDISHLKYNLQSFYEDLKHNLIRDLGYKYDKLSIIKRELNFNSPMQRLKNDRQDLDMILKDLLIGAKKVLDKKARELLSLENNLQLLNPNLSLKSGYGLLSDNDDNIIRSVNSLKLNDTINIRLKDGELKATVNNIKRESEKSERRETII